MKTLNSRNVLSTAVSALMTMMVCSSVSRASDIEIYSNATGGKTRIMFALDTSLSMASTWNNMACDAPSGATIVSRGNTSTVSASIVNGVSIPSYTRYYCRIREGSETRDVNDRITKLIDGMLDVLAGRNDITRLTDDIEVGLTRFSGNTGTSGSGLVLVPTRRLDASANATSGCTAMTQRACLVRKVAALRGTDRTPTGPAYGVAAQSLLNTIGTDTSECNGNGIYFLSDGGPSGQSDVANTQSAMSTAISGFTCPTSWNSNITSVNSTYEFKPMTGSTNNQSIWQCIAKFNQTLLNGGTNRPKIKTASVGFGSFYEGLVPYTGHERDKVGILTSSNIDIANILSNYDSITNAWGSTTGGSSRADIANTALWGIYGRGGWYSASQPKELAESILNFVDNVKPTFDPVTTGSPTLPQDALNPLRIQPYGYYASFVPKPQETTQLWVGNMNKYHIYNGELYNNSKTIRLIKADGSLDSTAEGLWTNGMKGQLPLGIGTNAANEQVANRTIYTNREITGTAAPYAASEIGSLKKVNVATLFGTGSTALFVNDPDKNYWLNLLGYNVGATETGITLANLTTKPELRQVGAVMHSTPILLTQSGKIKVTSGALDTTERDDYLLFGTTQGLLHVVDADDGKEKFTFAPNEMMKNQKAAFLSETSSTGGTASLFYGIDAPWTAFTQYVSKSNGTLTVKGSERNTDGSTYNSSNTNLELKGLQWVYGGLRMGGRSYYGLNLSDLDNPSLKFHVNPDAAVTTDADGNTTPNTGNALSYMGQSWSKPTLAYVKFGGVKKLVMFVGGGYDAGYENAAYNQNTTTGGGAGVYMFDANNGDLLWWSSANADAAKGAEAFTNASASTINMKYSVVSQINAIDRDSDGLVDNLYFGDLGGQGFRVDLNNAATGADASAKKGNFAKRVVRLFNEHATGGVSPRFYEMPSFSVHDGVNGAFGVLALSSGNRSSPLAGTTGTNASGVASANDAVFVIYDNDVARNDLYTTTSLNTRDVTLGNWSVAGVAQTAGTGASTTYNGGWKYTYSTTAGRYKGLNELYALDNMLYVNVFDRDGTGIGGTCGAGVKGDSYVYQFCLPTGECPENFYASGQTAPNSVKLGAGILGTGLGQGRSNANNTGLIVNRPNTLNCTTTPNLPECQEFTTTAKLRQLRWYETR